MSIQTSSVCGNSCELPVLWRCDVMLHRQTHFSTAKHQIQHICSPTWAFLCVRNSTADLIGESYFCPWQSLAWLLLAYSLSRWMSLCMLLVWVVLQTAFAGAPLLLAKEQISTWCSPSFWMNDLRSQLPGSLHQTWPTLIINDSGGQCPIFMAESSVMPGQTKPPEFHHFQLLLTPK